MKQYLVVTEGIQDVALLRAILNAAEDYPGVDFVAAGGWSSADSLARSFLAHGDKNVALVVDADTTDPNSVEHRRRFMTRSLGEISSPALWKVFVIEPEIERLLFADRYVIEALAKRPISDTEFVSAQFEPKAVLQQLLPGQSLADVYKKSLRQLDLSRIRKADPIPELESFLKGEGVRTLSARRASSAT